ncbi:MAG TPA: hypothetical protein VNJ52_09860 [Patescibacteria group bacterium]|nr:hypothetical protein [Patescibacteria group bacterium]
MTEELRTKKIPLIFFRTAAGSEPVREWLKGLPEAERQAIGEDLLRAQWRWPVGMPLCRNPDGPANETICARVALPLPGAPGRAARVHQENTRHAG